ncbi:VG15 protein [Streptomyces sp. NPDC001515]
MATRKAPKAMTDAELLKAIRDLTQEFDAAVEAAGWDDSGPEAQRLSAEIERYASESRHRMEAAQAAKKAASRDAKARKPSVAGPGGKFAPESEDIEAVLREALKSSQPGPDGKTYLLRLGGRSRRQQQAIRELAAEGLLKKTGRGHSSMSGGLRQAEAYSGQTYTITKDGEQRLREILAAKGEPLPGKRAEPVSRPAARPALAARPSSRPAPEMPSAGPRAGTASAASRRLAEARYEEVAARSRGVVAAVKEIWSHLEPERILAALQGESGLAILNLVTAGQLSVAQGAELFVTSAMLSQGAASGTAGLLVPRQLAGIAADGRSLATLLYTPGITTSRALALGATPEQASAMGLNQLARMVATTITDTARTATSVAMTANPRCVGYVRVVKLPACSRCIILAGRQYTHSEGFKRHPRCDCGMEPMSEAEWQSRETASSPNDLFKQMSPEERRKRFGAAGAEALEAGADMGQVVNARRGISTTSTGKKVTTEGTTKRGVGGKALTSDGFTSPGGRKRPRTKEARLMPEQILGQAHGNRELQISLLRKHGYIT